MTAGGVVYTLIFWPTWIVVFVFYAARWFITLNPPIPEEERRKALEDRIKELEREVRL
jgi:hypothetical protein